MFPKLKTTNPICLGNNTSRNGLKIRGIEQQNRCCDQQDKSRIGQLPPEILEDIKGLLSNEPCCDYYEKFISSHIDKLHDLIHSEGLRTCMWSIQYDYCDDNASNAECRKGFEDCLDDIKNYAQRIPYWLKITPVCTYVVNIKQDI